MVLCSSARLPVSVTRDETVRRYFGSPRRGKAAGGHIRLALRGGLSDYCTGNPHRGHAMTSSEIAILSVLIAAVVVSVWLGFLHREF